MPIDPEFTKKPPQTEEEANEYYEKLTTPPPMTKHKFDEEKQEFVKLTPEQIEWERKKAEEIDRARREKVILEKYFKNGKEFISDRVGKAIQKKYSFQYMSDSKALYCYTNGVWRNNGRTVILNETKEILQEKYKKNYFIEVESTVMADSPVMEQNEFFEDNNLSLINLENGVFDLETKKLLPHSPDYRFLSKLPVKYDPDAECPQIITFIGEVLPDENDRLTALEIIAYTLHRSYPIQKAVCLIGSGDNGKSVFLNLISHFLGKENIANVSLQELAINRFATADLFGKLANIHPDLTQQALKGTGQFKQITGGDRIRAERKGQNSFNYYNHCKQYYSANELPASADKTYAFYKRWILLEFSVLFTNNPEEGMKLQKKKNPNILKEITIETELSGLFNLCIPTLKTLLEQGRFTNEPEVADVENDYVKKSDPVGHYLTENIDLDYEKEIKKNDLYNHYITYCNTHKIRKVSNVHFYRQVWKEYGDQIQEYRNQEEEGKPRYLKGITFKTKDTEPSKPGNQVTSIPDSYKNNIKQSGKLPVYPVYPDQKDTQSKQPSINPLNKTELELLIQKTEPNDQGIYECPRCKRFKSFSKKDLKAHGDIHTSGVQ